jgi:hypothetical protein
LTDIAGDVKGKMINGWIHIALSGSSWKETGLNVETTNGGLDLLIPETYAAHIDSGTINGNFRSNIAAL